MTTVNYQEIPLNKIQVDKKQPRKSFDKQAIADLSKSIEANGVLQAILVRPIESGYQIVCGERRFRAAKLAKLTSIPATIKKMTDAEIIQAQIIENLQRVNVHPMEEAKAFKKLLAQFDKDIIEVANRVGHSPSFVRGRLKLNDLRSGWQKHFLADELKLNTALRIAKLPKAVQEDWHKEITQNDSFNPDHISDWAFRNKEGDLTAAIFNKEDAQLLPKTTACIGCAFNSATAILFPEDEQKPICSNLTCYQAKTNQHISNALEAALEDETILLVANDPKGLPAIVHDKIKDGKPNIYALYRDCSVLRPLDPMQSKEEFIADEYWDNNIPSKKEIQQDYKAYKEEYMIDLEEYQEKLEKAKQALIVDGNDIGKMVYVQISKKEKTNAAIKLLPKEEQVEATKAKMEVRESRMQELDKAKIFKAMLEEEAALNSYVSNKEELTETEWKALCFVLYSNMLHWDAKDKYLKSAKLNPKEDIDLFKSLNRKNFKTLQFPTLVRTILLGTLTKGSEPNYERLSAPAFFHQIMKEANPAMVEKIENNQNDIAQKRADRIKERIAKLK